MATQAQDSVFTYAPLRDGYFRVVEIMGLEPTINVQLTDYPDEAPPEYFAVSYAWGSEQNTETILSSGKQFKVTPHLKEGLRCIYTASGRRRFWVDAICINQHDDREKAMQVGKMHHIYRKSRAVYVWLGKEENDSDAAISAIKDMPDAPEIKDDLFKRLLGLRTEAPRLFDVSAFKPLAHLSRRTWFRRLWITQEYFYGQSVLFFCGMSVIDDAKLMDMINRTSINSFGDQEPPGYQEEPELFVGFQKLLDLKKNKDSHFAGKKLGFFDFVLLGRERLAKEPVDRVYAAFGMAEGSDTIYRKEILIDYSLDARSNYWRLYSNFGKIALRHEPNLRLLSIVSSEERPEFLPSWCPNLNSEPVTPELDDIKIHAAGWPFKEHGKNRNNSESSLSPKCFRHSNFKGKDENHVLTSPLTNTVSILGAKLGRISAVAVPCNWDSDVYLADIYSVKPLAKNILEWLESNEKFCEERVEDLAHAKFVWGEVLVGANDEKRRNKPGPQSEPEPQSEPQPEQQPQSEPQSESEPGPQSEPQPEQQPQSEPQSEPEPEPEPEPQKKDDIAYLFTKEILRFIVDVNPDSLKADTLLELLREFERVYMWLILIQQAWDKRALFITDNGKFGRASADVADGDCVCMLYGGRNMYVLRERDTEPLEYQFVSDAYVFDCMDGQVFDLMDEG